jgi:hypothetical protein
LVRPKRRNIVNLVDARLENLRREFGKTTWRVVEVPKPLRKLLDGKPRFIRSVGTDQLHRSEPPEPAVVAECKRQINLLKRHEPDKVSEPGCAGRSSLNMVRAEGLEPPQLSSLEPKSSASTSSATPAQANGNVYDLDARMQIIT